MFALLRVTVAAGAFLIRFFRPHLNWRPLSHQEVTYYFYQNRSKTGITHNYQIKLPVDWKIAFSFHFESPADRFFKRLGVSDEVQTGDHRFDSKIYVTSDHTGLREALQESSGLRKSILNIMRSQRTLSCDGRFLIASGDGAPQKPTELVEGLIDFKTQLTQAMQEKLRSPFWKDAYFYRTLMVESLVWAIAAYGIVSFFMAPLELDPRSHVSSVRLFYFSLMGGGIAAGGILFGLKLLFKGSSRPHRILIESALLLTVGLPTSAVQITADLNRELDRSPGVPESRTILNSRVRKRSGGKGSPLYTYEIYIAQAQSEHSLAPEPRWIRVSDELFKHIRSEQLQELQLVIAEGWLSIPWLRSIEAGKKK
jgi:hypothetical protein